MSDTTHLVGLLLGTETDWPAAFESIVRRIFNEYGSGRGMTSIARGFEAADLGRRSSRARRPRSARRFCSQPTKLSPK